MNADPDALRRAADEMDALITRQAAHLADIERLTAERAHIHESARERARKLNEVRAELGRAGYPVDECDWPTDALRQLVDAHLAGQQMILRCYDLLSAAGYQTGDIVERVKVLVANAKRDESMVDGVFRVLREAGMEGPHVVTMARALVAERDALRGQASHMLESRGRFADKVHECTQLLLAAGVNEGGVAQGITTLIGERDALRADLASLREKAETPSAALEDPFGPSVRWAGHDLYVNGTAEARVEKGLIRGWWALHHGQRHHANSLDSARRLAELLAGFDPGGVWRVAGSPVTVDVVKAVCPTVAVSWGAA